MFLILLGKVSNYYSNNKVIRSIKAPTLHFLMQSGQLWCVFFYAVQLTDGRDGGFVLS